MAHQGAWLIENKIFMHRLEEEAGAQDIQTLTDLFMLAMKDQPHKIHLIIDLSRVHKVNLSLSQAKQLKFQPVQPQQGHILFIMRREQTFYSLINFLAMTIMRMLNIPFHLTESLPQALSILRNYDPSIPLEVPTTAPSIRADE
jgi:hypothetical protein